MKLHYLEIVSLDMASQCATLQDLHGVSFSEPVVELGNARVAELPDGSRMSVREPMHETETPVVRPYFLTADIKGDVKKLSELGAEIAHPPLEIPGQGTFAIYIQGGIQHGLWQI